MDIFSEIRQLNFSLGEYVVVGSGIMAALGIKEARDIDIVLAPGLFEKCKAEGWELVYWTYPDKAGQGYLRRGRVELYLDVNKGACNPTTQELINEAVIIQGIPFIPLQRLAAFKKAYGGEKHQKDLDLIEIYLSRQEAERIHAG